jgi:hypothetical protein
MAEEKDNDAVGEIETALLDAELFIKYHAPERALKRLRTALEHSPRSIRLRERMREIASGHKHEQEAARQCLALASLYIERDNFDTAQDRLLEAKQLDKRISIAGGLEAIRRARHPERTQGVEAPPVQTSPSATPRAVVLAGDLASITIFDAIQAIENARLTGALNISAGTVTGRVLFNDGQIVGAESGNLKAEQGFRQLVEINSGTFDFEKSPESFMMTINAASNTNLILDSLRQMDEESMEAEEA